MQSANKDKGKSSVTVRRRYTASQVAEMLSYEQIPSDADDSEADVEEDLEELNQLNSTAGCSSASRSASGCQHCYQLVLFSLTKTKTKTFVNENSGI